MKNKIIKILIYTIIISSIIIYISFNFIPTRSYTVQIEKVVNTTLGDVILKTTCNERLNAGDIVPIEIYFTGDNIVSFMSYLKYDEEIFKPLNIMTNVQTLVGWMVVEGEDTQFGKELFINAENSDYKVSNTKIATIYLEVLSTVDVVDIDFNYICVTNSSYQDNIPEDGSLPPSGKMQIGDGVVKTYNIIYNLNTTEQIDPIENGIKQEGIDYKISDTIPERNGYKFIGWNTSIDGTGDNYAPGAIYDIDNELMIYAQWDADLYLSSNIYKIGNNDINNYEEGDKYISRIINKTRLQDYKNNISTNGTIKVLKIDGTELNDNEFVGTGMKLQVTKGNKIIELQIAVIGDLNGDGLVTVTDLSTLNQALLDVITIENEYKIAADFDENNQITVTDLSEFNKLLLSNM